MKKGLIILIFFLFFILFYVCNIDNIPSSIILLKDENINYNTLYGRVKEIIDPSNKILGHFYCQGKMPIAVRDRYVSMITQNPDDAKLKVSLQNFDEALNHPNNKDLKNVEQWIKDIINNN